MKLKVFCISADNNAFLMSQNVVQAGNFVLDLFILALNGTIITGDLPNQTIFLLQECLKGGEA